MGKSYTENKEASGAERVRSRAERPDSAVFRPWRQKGR